MQNQWNLFAPRVAIGYDPKGDGKMIIRASFGISYDYRKRFDDVNSADAPPFGGTTISMGPGQFSNPYRRESRREHLPVHGQHQCAVCTGGTYIAEQQDLKTTRSTSGISWSSGSSATTGSLRPPTREAKALICGLLPGESGGFHPGNCGDRLETAPVPASIHREQISAGSVLQRLSDSSGLFGGTSSYNGLILAVQKRLEQGTSINANYTWSHCIGDLSIGNSTGNAGGGYQILSTATGVGIPNNRRYDRSNCQSVEIGGTFSSDRRQNFNRRPSTRRRSSPITS